MNKQKRQILILVSLIALVTFCWASGIASSVASFWCKVANGLAPMYAFYDLIVEVLGVDNAITVFEMIEYLGI